MRKLKEFPKEFIQINIDLNFSSAALEKATNYRPYGMDEKWHAYVEDDSIYFHRLFFGYCIYKVKMNDTKDRLIELFVNNNPEQYKFKSIEYDVDLFNKIVDIVLNELYD